MEDAETRTDSISIRGIAMPLANLQFVCELPLVLKNYVQVTLQKQCKTRAVHRAFHMLMPLYKYSNLRPDPMVEVKGNLHKGYDEE